MLKETPYGCSLENASSLNATELKCYQVSVGQP